MQLVLLAKRGNSVMIVIPSAYLQQLGWGQGDRLMLDIVDGALRAQRVTVLTDAQRTMLLEAEEAAHGETLA